MSLRPILCPECGEERPRLRARGGRCSTCAKRAAGRSATCRRRHLAAIVERDGGLCGICGGPVDLTLTWPLPRGCEPGYATLDHVVPLVAGGSDEPDNLRLAHWICNTGRGAR